MWISGHQCVCDCMCISIIIINIIISHTMSLVQINKLKQQKQAINPEQQHKTSNFSTMTLNSKMNSQFFAKILQAQNNYYRNGDEQSMQKLLSFYTDCVYYFDTKHESISLYFQEKIKEVVKDIKRFGSQEEAEKNKQKMNKNIIRVMQDYNIHEQITKTQQKQKKMEETVNRITQEQAQNLRKRMMKSKRHINKTKSVTMSFNSFDSPDAKEMKKIQEEFGIDINNFYFSNDDDQP